MFDFGHNRLDRLQVLRVARQSTVHQWKAVSGYHQGQDNLLAVTAMISRITSARQVILLCQALEVGAGQVVEQKVVIKLEQRAESSFQILFDQILGRQQTIQCSVEMIPGHATVRDAEKIL